MKVITFMISVVVLSILIGCKQETTTSSGAGAADTIAFDYRLVGAWSDFDGIIRDNACVFGLQFGYDKSIRLLGVELATGLIAPLDLNRKSRFEILSAHDGIFVIRHHFCIGPTDTVKVRYRIEGNELILPDTFCYPDHVFCIEWLPKTLHRTKTGINVAMPHPFFCSVMIDDVLIQSRSVFACYYDYSNQHPNVGVNSPTMITLSTSLEYPWGDLWIPIDNFKGVGTYTIRDDQATFSEFCEDYSNGNATFDSSSRNFITINEFDIGLNRCSGRFELDISNPYNTPKWYWRLHGVFSLPIVGASQSSQLPELTLRRRAAASRRNQERGGR